MVVFAPEADFVARLDAERVAKVLGDDDLALGSDTVSHTGEYNQHGIRRSGFPDLARCARFGENRAAKSGPTSPAGLARAVGDADTVQRKFAGSAPVPTGDIAAWTRAPDLDGTWITKPPPPSL